MEFRILGPLEVVDGDRELRLAGPRQRALLALLLLHANEVVASERLLEDLWGGQPPRSGTAAVQTRISALRKALGPAGSELLVTRSPGYMLRITEESVDADRFERLFEQGRRALSAAETAVAAEMFVRALALWRGPALADFLYEPFAQQAIVRLEELRAGCVEARIEADLSLGRHAALIGELEGLVGAQPLRERPRGQLMLALYRTGRQADALAVYRDTRRLFADELGIEPGPALRDLETAILRHDSELDLQVAALLQKVPEAMDEESAPVALPAATRKTVTVLVSGLSEAVRGLDPELRRRLADRWFDEIAPTLGHHGAMVDRLEDGRVIGVFGMPESHEDDALRAVRAGLDLCRSWAARGENMRVGIDTGPVLAGRAKPDRPLITGDVVGAAALLYQRATSGVVIGESTRRLVRDAVVVEPLALAGGENQAGSAWLLRELVPGAPAFRRRFDARLVGRDDELAQLRQTFERARRERRAQLFTVFGEAGIGKTRLARELGDALDQDADMLTGHCLSYGEGITYWPLREILEQALSRRELDEVLRGEERGQIVADRVRVALGQAHGSVAVEETFWAFRKVFESLARQRPLILCFEDIHWAEPTLLDFVEHLADFVRDAPVLLLCLARPELLDTRPGWAGGKVNATSLLLEPLSHGDSEMLAGEFAGQLEAITRGRAVAAAQGNPLFLEQMLVLLAENDYHERDPGLPPAIQALLAARLEQLPGDENALLGRASVEGETFHVGAVAALSPEAERARIPAVLTELLRKDLVRPDRAAVAGEDAYRFQHALIRQAAYEALTKQQRGELHERLADWLEQTLGSRAGEAEEFLGYHLEQAYRYRSQLGPVDGKLLELAGRALSRLSSAGRRAFRRGDTRAAVNLLERARSLPFTDERAWLELAPDLGFALLQAGEVERVEPVLGETIERATAIGERLIERHTRLVRDLVRVFNPPEGMDLAETLREAEESLAIFDEAGDSLALTRAWLLVWVLYQCTGNAASQRNAAERALEYARRAGSRPEEALSLTCWGWSLVEGPTPVGEGVYLCEGLLRELRGDPLGKATASAFLATLVTMQGRFDDARELIVRSRAVMREFGIATVKINVEMHSSRVETMANDLESAERAARAATEHAAALGDQWLYVDAAVELARAVCDQGRSAECLEILDESERHPSPPDVEIVVMRPATRALALAQLGQLDEAETLARDAVGRVEKTAYLEYHAGALLVLAEVLRRAGRPIEAAAALKQAVRLFDLKGNVVSATKARALVESLAAG